jgi:hypothetical protein
MKMRKSRVTVLIFFALTISLIVSAIELERVDTMFVAAAQLPPVPICTINDFFISGKQSDGGAGSYDTFVYLTNSGPTCRLVPIGARGYNTTTHRFIGTTATISKPDIKPGQYFPYATRHLLGNVAYGQSVSLFLGYADVGLGGLRNCGKVATANSVAFWMTGHPHLIKFVHLVFYQLGWSTSLQTCSKANYLGVSWPSTGPFWFAS